MDANPSSSEISLEQQVQDLAEQLREWKNIARMNHEYARGFELRLKEAKALLERMVGPNGNDLISAMDDAEEFLKSL